MTQQRVLRIEYSQQYPWWTMVMAMALILAAPFVSVWLNYGAMALCLYRVIRYDAKVFATDYAILAPVSCVFTTSGRLSMLIILALLAALVLTIREGMKANRTFVLLLVLLNYLVMRMGGGVSKFFLCFGQIFLLWVLLPKQDAKSAEQIAMAFCISLLVTSFYALIFRGTWQLEAVTVEETEAIWGSGIMRFHGLIGDPNFYMTMLIMGLCLLIKLRETNRLKTVPFVLMAVAMTVLGVLTYSKTFFLVLILLGVTYIIWQFVRKKILWGIILVVTVVVAAEFLIFSDDSPFAVVVARLLGSEDLNDLTTGRMDVYMQYLDAITKNPLTFFFGYGFGAPDLPDDPHNIYLEIGYYCGTVGLCLIVAFFASVITGMKDQEPKVAEQSWISKYLPLTMALVLYISLNGMFMVVVYPVIFLSLLAILIPQKEDENA